MNTSFFVSKFEFQTAGVALVKNEGHQNLFTFFFTNAVSVPVQFGPSPAID